MPRLGGTHPGSPPPLVHILIMFIPRGSVQHRAQSTPKIRIDKLPRAFPPEVRIVQIVVFIQPVQIRCQFGRAGELVHVDVGALGGRPFVVLRSRSHHYGQHVLAQSVHEELLRDVIAAVRVLEGQVELVLPIEDLEALAVGAGTLEGAAGAVDVHGDVLGKFAGVGESTVAGAAVRYEPGDFFRFVGGVITWLLLLFHLGK